MTPSAKQAFRAHIITFPAVSALVSTGIRNRRVYFNKAPQDAVKPFIVLTQTPSAHARHMGGAAGIASCHVTCDCYGASDTEATALADAVRMACDGYRGATTVDQQPAYIRHLSLENDNDDFIEPQAGSDDGIYHVQQDWSIVIAEPVPTF